VWSLEMGNWRLFVPWSLYLGHFYRYGTLATSMFKRKTTFEDILKNVNKREGHGLTARLDVLRKRQESHLKSLGVRPVNHGTSPVRDFSGQDHDLYREAFEALRKSNRPWATESEIKSILYGNKPLSRERSAEVVEILRRARVTEFKETDEATTGDVYSERLMNVITSQQKGQEREGMQSIIGKVAARDTRNITPSASFHETGDEEIRNDPVKIVRLETTVTDEERARNTAAAQKKSSPIVTGATEYYHQRYERPANTTPAPKPQQQDGQEGSSDVPLTRDLDDPDV
jgi:hypothetical protein